MKNSENRFKYISFYMPEFVYIPFDNMEKLSLRKNKLVYCGECLGSMNDNTNIYTPVSGIISSGVNVNILDKSINSIVIKNDYRDKRFKLLGGKKVFDNYKRKECNELLDIFNLGRKYNTKKYLMIDFLCNNNNLESRYIALENAFEALSTIDALITIYNLDKAYIAVNDRVTETFLKRYSRMYPNIEFTRKILNNDLIVNYNSFEIISIYNALKYNRRVNEKYVTLVTKKDIIVVKTKINILVSELIKALKLDCNNVSVIDKNSNKYNDYNGIINECVNTIILKDA